MSTRNHISYLDSVRGLAALSVINEHYVIAYGLPCDNFTCQQLLDYSPLHFWWDGGAAVSMFFVLSGLVLSIKYFRHAPQLDLENFSLLGYSLARLFRIWLPYAVILLISAVLYLDNHSSPLLNTILTPSAWIADMWRNNPLSLSDMLRESFLINLPAHNVLLPQAWTLKIELLLSLLLPIGLLLIDKGWGWLIIFSLFAIGLLDVSIFLIHFMLGLLIARYLTLITVYLQSHTQMRKAVLLLGLLLYTSGYALGEQSNEALTWTSSGVGAALLICFVLGSVKTQNILSLPLLRQIGKVSFSAYLLHMAFLICLTPYLLHALESFTDNRYLLWFGGWLLTVLLVQVLSWLCYHLLETTSISMGKRLLGVILATK